MALYHVVIQELPKASDVREPALVSSPVRTLDVEVEAESWEDPLATAWEAWDVKHPGGRPEEGRFRVFRPEVGGE